MHLQVTLHRSKTLQTIELFMIYEWLMSLEPQWLPWGKSVSRSRLGSYFSSSSSSSSELLLEDSCPPDSFLTFTVFTSVTQSQADINWKSSYWVGKNKHSDVSIKLIASRVEKLKSFVFSTTEGNLSCTIVPSFWSSLSFSVTGCRSEVTLFLSSLMLSMISSAPCRVVGRNTGTGTWTELFGQ